jgi:Phasin protein
MAHKPTHSDTASPAAAKQVPMEFLKLGEAQTAAMFETQKELLDTFEQINREWLARAKSEADLWSELATKISRAHSVPEALGAGQECVAHWMRMAVDDGRRLFDDGQKVVNTITRHYPKNGRGFAEILG